MMYNVKNQHQITKISSQAFISNVMSEQKKLMKTYQFIEDNSMEALSQNIGWHS